MNKMGSIFVAISVLSFVGCSLREVPEHLQGTAKHPILPLHREVTAQDAFKKVGDLEVTWIEEDQSVSPVQRRVIGTEEPFNTVTVNEPLVVAPFVPDELQLSIHCSGLSGGDGLTVKVDGTASLNKGKIIELATEGVEVVQEDDGRSNLKFTILGLKQLLYDEEEAGGYLLLSVQRENLKTPLLEMQIPILTPPSRISVAQQTVKQFEEINGLLGPSVKILNAFSHRLDLLQVAKITNRSAHPVEIKYILKAKGTLSTSIVKKEITQLDCAYSSATSEEKIDLTSTLYIFPINDGKQNDFMTIINDGLASNSSKIKILPGEEKLLGIFGEGEQVVELMTAGRTQEKFTQIEVATECKSRCKGNFDGNGTASKHWQEMEHYPVEAQKCDFFKYDKGGHQYRTEFVSAHQYEGKLNECAHWDLGNGLPPYDYRRFCRSFKMDDPDPWTITKTKIWVDAGKEASPITLKFSKNSAAVFVSQSLERLKDEVPYRELENFFHLESTQLE